MLTATVIEDRLHSRNRYFAEEQLKMNLRDSKIIALVGQVIVLAVFSLLPLKVLGAVDNKGEKGKFFVACFRCFGGGALLGSYMLHQTPEIRELLEEVLLKKNNIHYPVPEAIAGGGFFLFLFIERFVMIYNHRQEKKDRAKAIQERKERRASQYTNLGMVEISAVSLEVEGKENGINGKSPNNSSTASLSTQASQAPLTPDDDDDSDLDLKPSAARSIILLIALSADGIFQGMAIGLKFSNQAVWALFTAVVCHEFVMAFCLGMELVRSARHRIKGVVVPAIIYSLTPAIGTAIGIGIFEAQGGGRNDSITLVNGILQSIATGVFLYVTFIGILAEELTHNCRLIKLIIVLAGFGLMAGLAAIDQNPPDNPDQLTTFSQDFTATESYWT